MNQNIFIVVTIGVRTLKTNITVLNIHFSFIYVIKNNNVTMININNNIIRLDQILRLY